jgi:hypothetical protein
MGFVRRSASRPRSLAQVSVRTASGESFDLLVREFLDTFYGSDRAGQEEGLRDRPVDIAPLNDAYLGAVCEHLALRHRLEVPDWADEQTRFLNRPQFLGGFERMKAILLVESPLAFRRRGLFVSANALSRPRDPIHAQRVEETEAQASFAAV